MEVISGSHKSPLYSHRKNNVFTDAIDENIIEMQRGKIICCKGKPGSVCLMHVNLLNGPAPNFSSSPRTLYINTFYAEDSIELSPNHLPSRFTYELVIGEQTGTLRCSSYAMKLPAVPKGISFFAEQEGTEV